VLAPSLDSSRSNAIPFALFFRFERSRAAPSPEERFAGALLSGEVKGREVAFARPAFRRQRTPRIGGTAANIMTDGDVVLAHHFTVSFGESAGRGEKNGQAPDF
jgi:hypothetical protein